MRDKHLGYTKEACIENFEEALLAQQHGAHQIELCSQLHLDGCTPPKDDVIRCLEELDIHTKVMIRPVAGSFAVTEEVYDQMKSEIIAMKNLGVQEVVFGLTRPDSRLDMNRITTLRDLAHSMDITIHKAIDTSVDILEDLEKLMELGGIKSVLTSGGHNTALAGQSVLRSMIEIAADIDIIPAGKITFQNIEDIHRSLNAKIYHGRRIVPLGS